MKLVIFTLAYLSVASLVCVEARDSKAIEDRLALKRRIQLQKQGNQLNPVSESPVVPDRLQLEEDETKLISEVETKVEESAVQVTSTTSIPERSLTTVNAPLPKTRSTIKPIGNSRTTKPTTEKVPDEETTTKAPTPIRKPTTGPKFVPVIKPFDPSRRQSVFGNPSRTRPVNTVVSIRPFKRLSSSRQSNEEATN